MKTDDEFWTEYNAHKELNDRRDAIVDRLFDAFVQILTIFAIALTIVLLIS